MELRRRRSTRLRPIRLTRLGSRLISCLACAVIVTGVYFSGAGQWLSRAVFAPLFHGDSPADAPAVEERAEAPGSVVSMGVETVTRRILLPAVTRYALQMGVYAEHDNAHAAAAELRARGAGGYILTDGDKYRVLAAAYPAEADCRSVKEKLLTGGVDSAMFVISAPEGALSITGAESQVAAYAAALAYLYTLSDDLYAFSLQFDRDAQALEAGRSELALIEDAVKAQSERFLLAANAAIPFDRAVTACYETLIEEMDDAVTGAAATRASFSSVLKRINLYLLDQCRLLSTLAGKS